MDNASLIRAFAESTIAKTSPLLANTELRIEPIGDTIQLWSKQEGMLASAHYAANVPWIAVKEATQFWTDLHETLLHLNFLPTRTVFSINGFCRYEAAHVPQGYRVNYTDALRLLQVWWQYHAQNPHNPWMGLLLWHGKTWHPIRSIESDRGVLHIFTWGSQILLQPADLIVWLMKPETMPDNPETASDPKKNEHPSNGKSLPSRLPTKPAKYMGNYLVEAGLLSTAQVDVALSDQAATGMRFGDIVASRGWLKEQTIEYLMKYLIAPQQKQLVQSTPLAQPELPPQPVPEPKKLKRDSASIHERETLVIQMTLGDRTLN
ncbi:MAG: hypothetical protein WCD18_13250 [Thermosynechococcaceae cyanobacterium]